MNPLLFMLGFGKSHLELHIGVNCIKSRDFPFVG